MRLVSTTHSFSSRECKTEEKFMTTQTEARQEYQQKVRAELDKLNAQIDEYKAKVNQMQADTAASYHERMEELYAKRDAAQAKLQELQQAGETAWSDIQEGFEKAWNDLTEAFDNASQTIDQGTSSNS